MQLCFYCCFLIALATLTTELNLFLTRKYKDDSTFSSITKRTHNFTNLQKREENALPHFQEHYPSTQVTSPFDKPIVYMRLWKGIYPDVYKRTRSGFVGMRGKKNCEVSEYVKKQSSGFFDMRGKKFPYEFQGKFVGVRGKKISHKLDDFDLDSLRQKLHSKQLMLVLTEENESEYRD